MYLYNKYNIRELCFDGINLPFSGTGGAGALIPTIKALSMYYVR